MRCDHIQPFRAILTNAMYLPPEAGAALIRKVQHMLRPPKMRRQGAAIAFLNGMETVRTIRADRNVEGADPGIAPGTRQISVRFENTVPLAQAQGGTAAEFAMAFSVG